MSTIATLVSAALDVTPADIPAALTTAAIEHASAEETLVSVKAAHGAASVTFALLVDRQVDASNGQAVAATLDVKPARVSQIRAAATAYRSCQGMDAALASEVFSRFAKVPSKVRKAWVADGAKVADLRRILDGAKVTGGSSKAPGGGSQSDADGGHGGDSAPDAFGPSDTDGQGAGATYTVADVTSGIAKVLGMLDALTVPSDPERRHGYVKQVRGQIARLEDHARRVERMAIRAVA